MSTRAAGQHIQRVTEAAPNKEAIKTTEISVQSFITGLKWQLNLIQLDKATIYVQLVKREQKRIRM